MPRVALTREQKIARQNAKYDEMIRKQIKMLIVISGMSLDELGARMGISRATMNTRMKNPGTMRKSEERIICQLCRDHHLDYHSECISQQ